MPNHTYSAREYVNMVYCYGRARGNASEVASVSFLAVVAVVLASTKPDKRSVGYDTAGWNSLAGWNVPFPPASHSIGAYSHAHAPASDTSSDVAGAVAAAKDAAAAVMAAQHEVAAAKHAAIEQQSIAGAKEVAAAHAAHKSEEAARHARAHALEAAQAAVQAQAQLAAAKARAAVAQKIAAAREAAAARALQRAAHTQAARLHNADIEALKLSVIQSSGAAGAAGAAQHAATAAAAALNTAGWNPTWPKPWASNGWAQNSSPWNWS